jgi:hypothetical protein
MDFSITRNLKYFADENQATSVVNRLIGIDPTNPRAVAYSWAHS